MGLQGIIGGYKGLQGVTGGYKGLQGVTLSFVYIAISRGVTRV